MRSVLLNCLPPTSSYRPGYSLSVIKSYLTQHGYNVRVKYWNIALKRAINHFWMEAYEDVKASPIVMDLMPFYTYYAITRNDNRALLNIKEYLLEFFPNAQDLDTHLLRNKELLCKLICEELEEINIEQFSYVYVQSKFYKYQLVATGVLCEVIKSHYPSIITIIEAQEFSRKALAIMDSFPCYDFATWGEYELSLLTLLDTLESDDADITSAPNIVYRDSDNQPVVSQKAIKDYIDINNAPYADFSDYMEQVDTEREQIIFPLEGGRGCHWNRCSFCYMNDGYRYRRKSPERMRDEVQYYIDNYGASMFYYIDNDVVGHDVNAFRNTLDYYIKIKEKHNFGIDFSEFIARDLDAEIIEKMYKAGFQLIQIGYESTSDRMLQKINKKSHFAHLILVCKWCYRFGIDMAQQNILRSMPFESDELILENIKNLYYLRFLLSYDTFCHSMRQLCIVSTSRYYKEFVNSGMITEWNYTPMKEFMVDDFIKKAYSHDVFLMRTNNSNPLWNLFVDTENFYKTRKFSYSVELHNGEYVYIEKQQDKEIKRFVIAPIEEKILRACDRQVRTLTEIVSIIGNNYTESDLLSLLHSLARRGVLYMSDIYDEVVSLISLP